MLTDKSVSDYDSTKKAEYYDAEGFTVADEQYKHKLNKPEPLSNIQDNQE